MATAKNISVEEVTEAPEESVEEEVTVEEISPEESLDVVVQVPVREAISRQPLTGRKRIGYIASRRQARRGN